MNLRENAMAIYNHEQPDFYGDLMDALVLCPDPFLIGSMPPQDGKEHPDQWGTVYVWLPGAPGPHPHVTDENAVVKDITKWEEQLKIPDISNLDWGPAEQVAASVDRNERFVGFMYGGGLFERSHHLMGMENAFCAYLEEPEAMKGMLHAIADHKKEYIKMTAEHLHPDIIFYHDDWGSKQNLFLPPDVWRDIIKPIQQEISDTIHECGMIYMHHADCICQPIVEDMVDLGIEIWQGVIAQNDIPEIQRRTQGKLAMVGGIDGPAMDIENITEEQIRTMVDEEIDRCCAAGRFFPGIPNGCCFREWNDKIVKDEIAKYGRQYAIDHPVK